VPRAESKRRTARFGTPPFAEFLPLAWILQNRERRQTGRVQESEWSDAVDPKLAMLIVLFGMIIALSHLDIGQIERLRERIALFRLRKTTQAADEARAS
jgi:hypothetical protein